MTHKSFKKWLTICGSLALLTVGYKVVKACSDVIEWFPYVTNITPESLAEDDAYKPFFYSMFYYEDTTTHTSRFSDINVQEWYKYLNNKVDTATIARVMYRTGKVGVGLLHSKMSVPSKQIADSLQRSFVQLHKGGERSKNFLAYLSLALQAESYASPPEQGWYYDYSQPKVSALNGLEAKLMQAFSNEKDAFIKERIWFQLVRYYFFYDQQKGISFFEKTKHDFSPSNIYYRTLSYAAGCYYKLKQYPTANYYYSLVFEGNNRLKTTAHWSFHPQEESDWNATLLMAKTANEKATLWEILGLSYSDELRSMKEIHKLLPNSAKMNTLLIRLLNISELNYGEVTADSARQVLKESYDWISLRANDGKVHNPFLWNVSAGYLAFLMHNYSDANTFYQKAKSTLNTNNELAANQLRLLVLINEVARLERITANDENRLLPDLQWLYFFSNEDYYSTDVFRTLHAQNWIRQTLSQKYLAQGDAVKAQCFVFDRAFYTNAQNLVNYQAFIQKSKLTAYDAFCHKQTTVKLADLYDYQAVKEVLKDGDLQKASNWFALSGYTVVLLGNPFNGKIQDCHDCDHAAPQRVKYTKGKLVQKLIEMKGYIAEGKDVYNNALLVGNAFYNMSFYGNARYFYEGTIIGNGMHQPEYIDFRFRRQLTDNSVAYKYYQLALQNATNDEQRARCLYMMAKCERNHWYNRTIYQFTDNEYSYYDYYSSPHFVRWNSFTQMKPYAHTKFYKDAIRECGYFRKAMK